MSDSPEDLELEILLKFLRKQIDLKKITKYKHKFLNSQTFSNYLFYYLTT